MVSPASIRQSGTSDNLHPLAGQQVINYYPAPNSEAFQGLPSHQYQTEEPRFYAPSIHHQPLGSYAPPTMYPGLAIREQDVVPYIFEPMPFGMAAPTFEPMPPADPTSSKDAPAIGTMGPIEYQPLGVSEAELNEMWALLEDGEGDPNDAQRVNDDRPMLLGDAWATSPEVALDAWSDLGRK